MSSDTSIVARGISKVYTVRHREPRATTLYEHILKGGLRRRRTSEAFKALEDVSFDVAAGEVVGIVGRNGAGKSTLLKILSRITKPSEGRIEMHGRVGSLLEVGTGLHPELTGRENIRLSGAIQGMRQSEITRRFSEIVEFSGVADFLDTPVKRYSSGMHMRLAFAVAAHLDAEILLVDEVLAVGDSAFQKKSMGRMQEVASSGRTVVFVSHNLGAVATLCARSIYLERGRVVEVGPTSEIIDHYIGALESSASQSDPERRTGSGEYRIAGVELAKSVFEPAENKRFKVFVQRRSNTAGPLFLTCEIRDEAGRLVVYLDSRALGMWMEPESSVINVSVRSPWLKPGRYTVDLYLCHAFGTYDEFPAASTMEVGFLLPYPGTSPTHAPVVLSDFSMEESPDPPSISLSVG